MSEKKWLRQAGILVAATLVICFSGCTANKKPSKVEATLANMAKDVVIPIEAENKKNPLPGSEQAMKEGRELYLQACAICHGQTGAGNGIISQYGLAGVANFQQVAGLIIGDDAVDMNRLVGPIT